MNSIVYAVLKADLWSVEILEVFSSQSLAEKYCASVSSDTDVEMDIEFSVQSWEVKERTPMDMSNKFLWDSSRPIGKLKVNRAQCANCLDVLVSDIIDEEQHCRCFELSGKWLNTWMDENRDLVKSGEYATDLSFIELSVQCRGIAISGALKNRIVYYYNQNDYINLCEYEVDE